jgi:hypothetical protein
MSTIAIQNQLTLLELAKNIDPQGQLHKVAEILTRTNRIWDDMPWFQANDIFSHVSAQEYSEPAGEYRTLNDGVATEDVQTQNVRDVLAMIETYCDSDKALVDAAPTPMAFRNGRAARFIRGLAKTFITGLFYGNNSTNPKTFNGLAVRLNALSGTNVVDCGGTGSDVTSIYVVQWGEGKVWCGYPRGSGIGVEHRDLGEVTATTAAAKKFQAYRDWFKVHGGLVVEDTRCIGRLANIESSGTSNTFDEDYLIELMNLMLDDWTGSGIYVNQTVMTQMEIRVKDKSNVNYSFAEGLAPGPVLTFKGVPVRKCEAILNTETAVS